MGSDMLEKRRLVVNPKLLFLLFALLIILQKNNMNR